MASSKKTKQTYKYCREKSILGTGCDEYALSQEEYFRLYSFYVTYSMCGAQSFRKLAFTDYGWPSNKLNDPVLKSALLDVLNFAGARSFVFTDGNDLFNRFSEAGLQDGEVDDLSFERAVIGKTSGSNRYLKLFYRIRNCLAHGKFALRFDKCGQKMVVMQDDDTNNVTARTVLKLDTLLAFVEVIDKRERLC